MKKPVNYDLKKWLCEHLIIGLEVVQKVTSEDTADTYWKLYAMIDLYDRKETRAVEEDIIEPLVYVKPDWAAVLRVKDSVRKEVDEWDKFVKTEIDDFEEYKRLKKKFEGD